jgi:membrane fusion protein (multidrug efflux system)
MKFLKATLLWWVVALIVVALAVPRIIASRDSSANPSGAAGPRGPGELLVDTFLVEPQPLSEIIRTTGTLLADEEVVLTTETAGRVVGIYFEEGTLVNKNSLLVKINDAPLRADRERLLNQKTLAELRERRLAELLEENATSQDTYEIAVTEVKVLEAQIQGIDAQIEKTEILAPFEGVVGLRQISPGAFLQSNSPVATLRRLDPLRLEFTIPERYADFLRSTRSVTFRIQNVLEEFTAEIYAVEPNIERATRSIRVRANFPNPNYRYIPGTFARVEFSIGRTEEALLVPAMAIIVGASETALFVYEDGKAQRRVVQTGIRTEDRVQILEGVSAGERVITTGTQQLRNGMSVRSRG